jgi:hypothetical protein
MASNGNKFILVFMKIHHLLVSIITYLYLNSDMEVETKTEL